MSKSRRILFKLLAIALFALAIASIVATLFAVPGSGRSPGLFFAVVLAGLGKWVLGKSQGKSAQETFGRSIDVAGEKESTGTDQRTQ